LGVRVGAIQVYFPKIRGGGSEMPDQSSKNKESREKSEKLIQKNLGVGQYPHIDTQTER